MPVIIEENGIKIAVDVTKGHKTGFYLDQRDNRAIAARFVKGKSVLNCFCYTGTFGLYAAKAGAASIENVDVSSLALDTARLNMRVNGLSDDNVHYNEADVFKLLRQYRDEGKTFDVIVLDPPKFADNKSQLNGACRGYKDINMLAMQLLNPGGILLTFSCSGLMATDLFQKIVADAALDARLKSEWLDVTLPGRPRPRGTIHPVSQVMEELTAIFADMGFAVAEGPQVESDWYNFDALNIPPEHPARQEHDTFFMARAEDAPGDIRHSSEMGDIRWVRLDEARELPLPTITGLILGEIGRLVKEPPDRKKQRKIPLFTTIHRKHLMIEE